MSKEKQGVSGRVACVAAIRAAGEPLTAGETATVVVEAGVVPGLRGKTPKATLSAQITSSAKKGEVFRRVGNQRPAAFELKDDAPETSADLVQPLRAKLVEIRKRQQAAKAQDAEQPKGDEPKATAAAAATAGKGADVKPDPKPQSTTGGGRSGKRTGAKRSGAKRGGARRTATR